MKENTQKDGWDIRLQCTACNVRVRRHRKDYPGFLGDSPKATVETVCHNCTTAAGCQTPEVRTLHFIDFATDAELAES